VNKEIVIAIQEQAVLQFVYNGEERVVEPQAYGIGLSGREVLRARQIGGGSQSGQFLIAKLFDVEKISGLKETGEHFRQALPQHNPKDSAMRKVFISLPRRR
jgi:hypothetical protein